MIAPPSALNGINNILPPAQRRGFLLYVALGIMCLVCLMILAHESFIRGDVHYTFRLMDIEQADLLCFSALNIAMKKLDQMSIDELNLRAGSVTAIPVENDPHFMELVSNYGDNGKNYLRARASVTILTQNPFKPDRERGFISLLDPVECYGLLLVEAHVSFRGVRRFAKDIREYRLVNTTPPVVSHFSLFLSEEGKLGNSEINIIANDRDGNVRGEIKPLFIAGGSHMDVPLERKGWIFLGGGKIILNLSQGHGSGGCGESFHLLQDPTRIDLPNDSFIIVNRQLGWTDELEKEEVINKCAEKFLASYFKLYGNESDAAQTPVLGEVYRSYFKFSAIFDVDSNRIIRNPRPIPYVPPEEGKLIKELLIKNQDGNFMMMKNISYEEFSKYMSNMIVNPYNCSFDTLCDLKNNRMPVNPPHYLDTEPYYRKITGEGVTSYPNDARKVSFSSRPGGKYFEGDLNRFSLNEYLFERTSLAFKDQADFTRDLSRKGGVLCGINRILSHLDLSLTPELNGSGMIIADGDIRIGELRSEDPVTIVSLGGNILINGKLENTGLVALGGRIISQKEINQSGFLAAKLLIPAENRQGGRLVYQTQFNPLDESCIERRTFSISPFTSSMIAGFDR